MVESNIWKEKFYDQLELILERLILDYLIPYFENVQKESFKKGKQESLE